MVQGGALSAFNLNEMIPTSDTSTWVMAGKLQAVKLSPTEHNVSFVRIGYTKDRLMGESSSRKRSRMLIKSGIRSTDQQLHHPIILRTPSSLRFQLRISPFRNNLSPRPSYRDFILQANDRNRHR